MRNRFQLNIQPNPGSNIRFVERNTNNSRQFMSQLFPQAQVPSPLPSSEPFSDIISPSIVPEGALEIVTSRYNETLEWLKNDPFDKCSVVVYNKGSNDQFYKSPNITRIIDLSNIGLEVHTFLYHIINNYDNLANITAFFQASINAPNKYNRARNVVIESVTQNTSIFSCVRVNNSFELEKNFALDYYELSNPANRTEKNSHTHPCKIRPLGKWYQEVFGDTPFSNNMCWNHVFAVKKEHILRQPKEYYEKLISFLEDVDEEGLQPEAVHYFERTWASIFHPLGDENFIFI